MINLNTFTKYNKRNYLSDDWVKNLVEILSFVYCFFCVWFFLAAANVKMNFSINERSTHSLVMVLLLFVGFFFEMSSHNILIISDKKQAISKQIQISICSYQVMRGIIWYIYICFIPMNNVCLCAFVKICA